jgi:hypothetical protein
VDIGGFREEVKYSPESKLLYLRLDEFQGERQDIWIMAHLSENDPSPCFELETNSGDCFDDLNRD